MSNGENQGTLLVVDDTPTNLNVLLDFLHEAGFKALIAKSGESALRKLSVVRPDIILLDVMMPGMNGFQVCETLKKQPQTRDIPVIFMTALVETVDKVKGFKLGAADYITKPFEQEEVLARINTHIRLYHLQNELKQKNLELAAQKEQLELRNHTLTQLTDALQSAKIAAEEANHAKSQFIASMTHELRTPMNAIIGYSEMLREEAQDGEDSTEMVQDLAKINYSGKHLLSLINDILDFSKIEAGKMELYLETFKLQDLIDEIQATVQPLAAKNQNQFIIDTDTHIEELHADQTKLRQIVINLLSNAFKFTKNGTITLSVSKQQQDKQDWLQFVVKDTGIGMNAEQLHKIFQAFTQADSSITSKYGGTGLGLAISKHFSEMMGGRIEVESEVNKGSAFTVIVPQQIIDNNPQAA